jgi:molecular chaperone GrpE
MSDINARTEDSVLGPAGPENGELAGNGGRAPDTTQPADPEETFADAAVAGPPDSATKQPNGETGQAAESSGPEESTDYLALAQRTQADFENYRKRMARELESAQARGVARLAKELLPALDNLERAVAAAQGAANFDQQLIEGLLLVHRELQAALERAGVERYGAPGEAFDPVLHEAVAHQPVDGAQPGAVVEVYQSGYRIAGAVIRPARVLVAA